ICSLCHSLSIFPHSLIIETLEKKSIRKATILPFKTPPFCHRPNHHSQLGTHFALFFSLFVLSPQVVQRTLTFGSILASSEEVMASTACRNGIVREGNSKSSSFKSRPHPSPSLGLAVRRSISASSVGNDGVPGRVRVAVRVRP
ncbi:hypothetical protein CISIN_1g039835mg, partial [Citrus sinensis]